MVTQLSRDALLAAAHFFGISDYIDEDGRQQWFVNVRDGEPQGLESSQHAFFDESSRRWIIPDRDPMVLDSSSASEKASTPNVEEDLMHHNALQSVNWVDTLPDTDFVRNFRGASWDETPVGKLRSWPICLRLYTHLVLSKDHAAVIYWGKDRTPICNELGEPLRAAIDVPSFTSVLDNVNETMQGSVLPTWNNFIQRGDHLEEAWWTGHVSPLADDEGLKESFLVEFDDRTQEILLERRTRLVNGIGQKSIKHPNSSTWEHIRKICEEYPTDITMALLYSAETNETTQHTLQRECTIGFGTSSTAAPQNPAFTKDSTGFVKAMWESRKSGERWTHFKTFESFPQDVIDGVEWQGYGEVSRSTIVIPIVVLDDLLKGFIVLGLNPRVPFDDAYKQFLSDLHRQLIYVFTSDISRGAAQAREARLSAQLADSERRVRRMAEMAPVGMYELSAQGPLEWANKHFFDVLGCKRTTDLNEFSWQDWILAEDMMTAMTGLMEGIQKAIDVQGPLRLNRKWRPPAPPGRNDEHEEEEHAWVLYQAYPHLENGKVISLMGCLTDISQFKWAEKVQARSAEAARIAKQRQEDFIDITSHEMRNPLSAIQQCADSIVISLEEQEGEIGDVEDLKQRLKSNVEAAESILLCATHQRRIIDDVLTLSKIDSAMLSVVPVIFKPDSIIQDAMHMFQAEFTSSDIEVQTSYNNALLKSNELVMCDPVRLMQVLVNLLTNAIKFTRTKEFRSIHVSCGCVTDPPEAVQFGSTFAWSSSGKQRPDLTLLKDYGEGEIVYVYYSVTDTGQGIPSRHAIRIFDKFVQASRRTHIKYGGSGLGLFISRELTEVQGGRIGVGSEEGEGSTFTFYVKARRSTGAMAISAAKVNSGPITRKASTTVQPLHQAQTKSPPSTPLKESVPATPQGSISGATLSLNILMVEDNLLNQKVLAKQLRKKGCEVHVANHGGEAVDFVLRAAGRDPEYNIESTTSRTQSRSQSLTTESPMAPTKGSLAHTNRPILGSPEPMQQSRAAAPTDQPARHIDCILMDWEMPICDGLTATRRIRELESKNALRQSHHLIIGVTANARREQINVAVEAGMDAVVVKPFSVPELMKRIDELILTVQEKHGSTAAVTVGE